MGDSPESGTPGPAEAVEVLATVPMEAVNEPGAAPGPGDATATPLTATGSPSPAPAEPLAAAASSPDRSAAREAMIELNALLGQGTRYAGKLWFDGRVRIEGRYEGDIRGDVLVIGAGAEVQGSIEVEVCIVIGGQVRANIRARDAIELHAPATVKGDLHAPNVFIDRGVQFEGNCRMAPLDDIEPEPAPPVVVEAARATQPGLAPLSVPPPPVDEAAMALPAPDEDWS